MLKYLDFTFHYVSIKTKADTSKDVVLDNFTFHYVSIKTRSARPYSRCSESLHSTISLLKPRAKQIRDVEKKLYIPLCLY